MGTFKVAKLSKEYTLPKAIKMKRRSVFSLFFETILEIIEDKHDSSISTNVFCFLIMLYMLQIGGYTFQYNSLNGLKEEKMRTMGRISEQSTGTYFLFLKGEEGFIIWTFFIAQALMYTYIIYLVVITLAKRYLSALLLSKTKKLRHIINRILTVYFLMYIWAFFIPNIEINAGIASCGNEGYLVQYNGDNCSKKPIIYTLVSAIGLGLTAGTVLTLLFFFRNYEFDDSILLKRRFKLIQVFQLCFYFLTIFSYFLKIMPTYFTFFFIEVIAVTYVFDSVVNVPFRNESIAKFYVTSSIIFAFLVNTSILWYYNTFFPDQDLLYTNLIIGAVLCGLSSQIWSFRFSQIMHITSLNFEKYHGHLDFYLEQLFRLGQSSSISERDKFYLFELIIYHQTNCIDEQCYCKITTFKDEKDNLIKEDLYKLIDSIFIWSLNQPIVQKNVDNLEHLSLKFITYLTKYRNNSFRAYYYLKCIVAKHERLSLYFKTLSSILSAKIEDEISHQQLNNLRQKSNESQHLIQKKQINQIIEADQIEEKFLPRLIQFMQSKYEYYSSLKEQNLSLQGFSELTLQVCSQALIMKELYSQYFVTHPNASTLKKSYRISKLKQVFSVVVLNELFASVQDEIYLNELIRNDQNKYIDQVSNISVLRGDVITLQVSISKQRGDIISNNLRNVASFFGYTQQDIHKIKNINSLMPGLFSDIHDYFINNSIQRGFSKLFQQKLQTFAIDSQRLLVPINLYLSYSFDKYNDCCLCGTIVKRDTNNSYILFDQFGNIQGMTEKVFTQLFKTKPQKDQSEVVNSLPETEDSKIIDRNASQIEQYFKGIEPSTVYQKFSVFLIIPQIVRLIRKQFKEAEVMSQITHNKDPYTNKFSASLCMNKVYKIRIPYNYLELSSKLNQIANPSHFAKDKMLFSSKSNKNQEIDFQSYYKSISSFYKRHSKFYENNDNCYKQLDMVFNLQFFEYFYDQNHVKKTRSFYCIEIVDILQNASESRLNFLQKIAPLLDESEHPTTLENTIESSHFSYNKGATMQDRFQEFSDEEQNKEKQQKDQKVASQLIQQEDEETEEKNELSPSRLQNDEIVKQCSNSDSIIENSSNSKYQQQSPFFQPQKPSQTPMIPLAQISTSDNIIEKEKTESTLTNKNAKEKKNLSKQITFEPNSSLNPTKSIQDLIEDAQNKDIQSYQEIEDYYNYNNTLQSKNQMSNKNNSPNKPKKYSWDMKLKSESFQQKRGQDEDENEFNIPSEIINLESRANQTFQNYSIYNNNIYTNGKNEEYSYNQLGEYSSRNQKFEQSITTARALMEQNMEDTSTKNINEVIDDHPKHENNCQNTNKSKKNQSDYQKNNYQTDLRHALTKRASLDERQNKEQILLQHLNNKNSSQHSLSSMLNSSKNRLIYQIHDSVNSHQIVKIFNLLSSILLIAFVTMIFVYSIQINDKLHSVQDSFESTFSQSNVNQQYSNILQMALQLYQINHGYLKNIPNIVNKKNQLLEYLTDSIQTYQENNNEYMANYITSNELQSETLQVSIYNNMKEQETSLSNYLEFDLLNLKNILSIQQLNEVDNNSLFYMMKNMILFNENQKRVQEIIFNNEKDNESTISNFNIFTFILTMVVYSLICLSSLYLIQQIYNYKEKLLQTIARIHVQECEKYAFISKTIIQSLADPSQSWLQSDFVTLNFFSKSLNFDLQNSPRKESSTKNSKQQHQFFPSNNMSQSQSYQNNTSPSNRKSKKSKRNQMISTSFTQQKLSKWKKMILLFLTCLICIMFFSIINLIVKNFYSNFNEPVHIHQHSQEAIENLIQMKVFSEILSTYKYISHYKSEFPLLDIPQLFEKYQDQISEVSLFIPEFLSEFGKLSSYSSSQTNKLSVIFKESLCIDDNQTETTYKYDCEKFPETQREMYESGLSGVINRYIQLFNSNKQLFSNVFPQGDHETYLIAYQSSTDYLDLMIERSFDINKLLNQFKDIITNICSDFTSQLRYTVQLYCIIFGCILVLFLLLAIFFSKMYLLHQLRCLTFGLTLIPYSKLQEESTIQILKLLSKS